MVEPVFHDLDRQRDAEADCLPVIHREDLKKCHSLNRR